MMAATVTAPPTLALLESRLEGDVLSDLIRWVNEQVAREAVRFMLGHQAETLQAVDEWFVEQVPDPDALAHTIYARGIREARNVRESMTYFVYALRENAASASARFSFRVECGGSLQSMSSGYKPDLSGVVTMLMTHTDAASRLSLGHSREIVDQYNTLLNQGTKHLIQMLDRAHERNRELELRELALRDKLMDLAGDRELELKALQHRAALDMEEVKQKGERFKERAEVVKSALPGLNQLFEAGTLKLVGPMGVAFLAGMRGGRPSPSSSSPPVANSQSAAPAPAVPATNDLVDRLLASVTKEQVERIGALLSPEQVTGIVMSLTDEQQMILALLIQHVVQRISQEAATTAAANDVSSRSPASPSVAPPPAPSAAAAPPEAAAATTSPRPAPPEPEPPPIEAAPSAPGSPPPPPRRRKKKS
jgi:hypothetical protein